MPIETHRNILKKKKKERRIFVYVTFSEVIVVFEVLLLAKTCFNILFICGL